MATFNGNLRDLRNMRKLTQEQLADALHITKQALSHYERGTRYPKPETLEAIADYFNVDMDYLTGRSSMTTVLSSPAAVASAPSSLSQDQECLLQKYEELNDLGKEEALKRVSELTEIQKYTDFEKEEQRLSG